MAMISFESYEAQKITEGFEKVLVKDWAPHFANEPHSHDWDTEALVAEGEFWLSIHGIKHHFKTGDTFTVLKGEVHSETYGPQGAVFWAARKN
jgi:quercetin dioxygenase-like cupin family protein